MIQAAPVGWPGDTRSIRPCGGGCPSMSMRGLAMGGGRGGGWGGMRSLRQDRSVLQHRVKKGTARRMMTFSVPYRSILAVFLPVVILDAAIGAVNPLILRALIDNGIAKKDAELV